MFRFKRFSVDDDGCTMKVGTDAVLLACLAHSSTQFAEQRILDIGTGCGVIALITAQRFEKAQIVGIDIDEGSCLMAASNFEHSPWSHRLEARCGDVRNLAETEQYTMILSNPPYFHNSLKSSEKSRNLARHNDSLPIEHLLESAQRLLSPGGLLWTILPIAESSQLVAMGSDYNFLAL